MVLPKNYWIFSSDYSCLWNYWLDWVHAYNDNQSINQYPFLWWASAVFVHSQASFSPSYPVLYFIIWLLFSLCCLIMLVLFAFPVSTISLTSSFYFSASQSLVLLLPYMITPQAAIVDKVRFMERRLSYWAKSLSHILLVLLQFFVSTRMRSLGLWYFPSGNWSANWLFNHKTACTIDHL